MTDCIRIIKGKRVYWMDGRKVSAKVYHKRYPIPKPDAGTFGSHTGGWPMMSDALAVHPSLRADAEKDAAAKGCPTDFAADGRPILRDKEHRKRFLQTYGYYDRNAGYSDPAPGYAAKRGLPERGREGPMTSLGY